MWMPPTTAFANLIIIYTYDTNLLKIKCVPKSVPIKM